MKKLLGVLLATSLTLGCACTSFANTIPRVYLNDNKLLVQKSPFNQNGYTYIPLRTLSDNIGATLTWNPKDSTFTMVTGTNTIEMRINNPEIHINSQAKQLSSPAILKNGVTYVPVRFIKEALGADVSYNQTDNQIFIKMDLPKDGGQKYDSYGRLERTTNLPSNASSFEYILNGVPNSMYDSLAFWYDRGEWKITPVEGKNYIKPVNMKTKDDWATNENIHIWAKNFEKNLNLRLNADYRTIGSNWVNGLMDTYPSRYGIQKGDYEDTYTAGYTKELNDYVKYVKDNHLIIEGDYYVEPSTAYLCTGAEEMRCWVKFRIKSDKVSKAKMYEKYYPEELKTNTWYSGYVDLTCGSNNMGSDGSDLTIDSDNLDYGNVKAQ